MPRKASSIAAVHDETDTAYGTPSHAASSSSNATHSGPVVTHPERSTRSTAGAASGAITGRENGTP